ncbi:MULTISPECIES: sugar transferase [Bacillus cereus group]|uniref:sugar transferase n=1 Tax=Bacillus cereus group TaxID=86661 RepID=UPI00132E88C7|nr:MULTISPECIES: sugar transferase [Bacillus cereus group]HDR7253084.1 sugar transferase [Bacillus pacificus]MCC2399289.1 sugar transferase [Bacillus paranthracis]MDA1506427.1 sugar transferase [Bacillus cereus group sp. TH36-2LC]MDA2597063.1 sugar transferase [Bacillus cereus group sp. Bc061]QHH87265.1 sugar transferase [Bacillus paranthracis]
MTLTKVSSGTIKEQGLLAAEEVNQNSLYLFTKRLMDIVGAICGLVFLSPIFIIIAIVIKLEDPKGPVLFKQIRVGKDGKEFGMYKFRSMVTDAEERLKDLLKYNEVSGAMFKMKEDPRVTKIGKFIRKTSIDELPQLLNVLKGDMSLVGPRPPLPREVKQYTSYDKQRLLVTPGCTGLWQISGRSNTGFKEMVDLDIFYIQRRNILFDIKIILRTLTVLIGSKDAF